MEVNTFISLKLFKCPEYCGHGERGVVWIGRVDQT
jgi:hypothetical protein